MPKTLPLPSILQGALEHVNIKEYDLDGPLELIITLAWARVERDVTLRLMLCDNLTSEFDAVLRWGYQLNEEFPLRRKFSGSFASLRASDHDGPLFPEFKRSIGQILCVASLSALVLALTELKDSEITQTLIREACRYAEMCIVEVHVTPWRRLAYLPIIRQLFRSVGLVQFKILLVHLRETIETSSKSPYFEMVINSLSDVTLALFPSDCLDSTLDFIELIGNYFVEAKGMHLRESLAITLHSLLLPFLPTASAEVNIPRWGKVIQKMILKRALNLCERQKYRSSTLKLVAICLCLCDRPTFIQKWHELAEAIISFILDGSLNLEYLLVIAQLTWVYMNKYPEALATISGKIWSLLVPFIHSKSKRIVDFSILASFAFTMVSIVGSKQPVIALRDMILSQLDGCDRRQEPEDYPYIRVILATLSTLYFASHHDGTFPYQFPSEFEITELCDNFIHYQPDLVSRDVLDSIRVMLARILFRIDTFLFDPTIYDVKKGNGTDIIITNYEAKECTMEATMLLFFQVCPYLCISSPSDAYMLKLLTRYIGHTDEALSEAALTSFKCIMETVNLTTEELQQIYLVWTSLLDRIPDRHVRCLSRVASILPKLFERIQHLQEQLIDSGQWVPLIRDLCSRIILIGLNEDPIVTSFLTLLECSTVGTDVATKELRVLLEIIKANSQFPWSTTSIIHIAEACPIASLAGRTNIMSRTQEIQILLTGKSQFADDALVRQWGLYQSLLFRVGLPENSYSSISRKSDISKLFKYLSFSKSTHEIDGGLDDGITKVLEFFRSLLPLLQNDNELVCTNLAYAVQTINPKFMDDFFTALEPYLSQVSDDFCNIKYQSLKKNRKVDALKIDLCRILTGVISSLMEKSPESRNPTYGPHQVIRKYILEAFYFCSEIDTEEFLPGLRVALAELVRAYHDAIRPLSQRYDFFPFKLQTELFATFRKWYEQRCCIARPPTMDGYHFETNNLRLDATETERIYAETMASLCHGLISPLPQYRQDSISSSHVLRWVDSLIGAPWGPIIIENAIGNLLS